MFIYTSKYSSPQYSISRVFTVVTEEETPTEPAVPTIPPRIAPTVPPTTDSQAYYCGDETCDSSESCQSCPLDCGLCSTYTCSPQYCSLPSCQCAATSHPSHFSQNEIPQFVTITWDDAQTPTTFPHVMSVSRLSSVYSILSYLIRHVMHLVVTPK